MPVLYRQSSSLGTQPSRLSSPLDDLIEEDDIPPDPQNIAPGTDNSLRGIIDSSLRPELNRLDRMSEGDHSTLPGTEDLFNKRISTGLDFQGFDDALSKFAGGLSEQLFGAGGSVETASRSALGEAVGSGFGPTSGGFDNARLNILKGAGQQFNSALAEQAVNIAGVASQQRSADINSILGLQQSQAGRRDSIAESIFGAQATIDQQGFDRETMDLNKQLIEQALRRGNRGRSVGSRVKGGLSGSASGAVAGTIVAGPGIGTTAGAIIGGLAGLFG